MLQIFSPLLCQLILSQTILSSSPSTSSWSRPQNELLSPTNALEASTVSERRQNALLKAGNGYNHTSPNCQSQEDSAKGGHVLCRVWQCLRQPPPLSPFTIPSLGTSLSLGLVRASTPKVLCYYGRPRTSRSIMISHGPLSLFDLL